MYKIANGGVIRKADGALIPSSEGNRDWREYQEWLAAGNTPDPAQSADETKAAKWDDIKAVRNRRKAGGFKVKVGSSNKWFHSDADSRIQHLGLKDKARDLIAGGGQMTDKLTILGHTVKWKTLDGSFVDVSAQVAFDIVSAAGDLDAQLFAAAETHKAAMEASADPASYDFSAGWPPVYGD
jgi:hypothetical protein